MNKNSDFLIENNILKSYCGKGGAIVIPNGVTSIDDDVFCDCESLTSVKIPDSVTTIGAYAFCGCTGLTMVEIPNNVTDIGADAFVSCECLRELIM